MTDSPILEGLALYGTLRPGSSNHHIIEDMSGHWTEGTIKGHLVQSGWAAKTGYPALKLDQAGEDIPVWILESEDLVTHWARLDEFEGAQYQRVQAQAQTEAGEIEVQIYVSANFSD